MQQGNYGASNPLAGGYQCLAGYGPSLGPGGSTPAITYACSFTSYDIATYAVQTDQTIRFYPLQQEAACLTALPSSLTASVQACSPGLATQKWNYVGGLIQSVADTTLFLRANGQAQTLTLVGQASATIWTTYKPLGETVAQGLERNAIRRKW